MALKAALIKPIADAVGATLRTILGDKDATDARDAQISEAALEQFAAEFVGGRRTWFDALVDGLNRMPRPMLAFGTIFLFTYAIVDPATFSVWMAALALIPEPLWWMLGAIVGFFFGARELHHLRAPSAPDPAKVARVVAATRAVKPTASEAVDDHAPMPGEAIEDLPESTNEEHNPALNSYFHGDGPR